MTDTSTENNCLVSIFNYYLTGRDEYEDIDNNEDENDNIGLDSIDINNLEELLDININMNRLFDISTINITYIIKYCFSKLNGIIKLLNDSNLSKDKQIKALNEYIRSITSNNNICTLCEEIPENITLNCGHKMCSVCYTRLPYQKCPWCTQPIN